jgi:hypothetical protein
MAAAQNLERQLSDMGDVPSRDQLQALQNGIDRIQISLMACRPRWIRGRREEEV